MKTIGFIGGLCWESSKIYYERTNFLVREKLGGVHSAECIMTSVDFTPVAEVLRSGKMEIFRKIVVDSAKKLQRGGADFLVICSNTAHAFAEDAARETGLPLLHIADAIGEEASEKRYETLGLLGTKTLMESSYYRERLEKGWQRKVLIPEEKERIEVDRIIVDELCAGKVLDSSRSTYLEIMEDLRKKGAQAIVLGCTEIPILIQQKHTSLPLLDSLEIHVQKTVKRALEA
ncbi:MAG TPA: amino acid racemase [Synergistaceae bacterium]|nr:amino acid racemase [Synergistaceae bacterium]HPJ25573.1 amino acid racemase [Synergistaceae bacterium]